MLESLAIGLLASVDRARLGLRPREGAELALRRARARRSRRPAPSCDAHLSSISLLLGVLVTVLAGFVPALRATRVPPIAAVREGAVLQREASALGPAAAGCPVRDRRGTARLRDARRTPRLGQVAARAGGRGSARPARRRRRSRPARRPRWPRSSVRPAQRFGGAAGRLATDNATRNPARTAATAAALMIGLALVTFVAVLGKGLHGSVDRRPEQAGRRGLGGHLPERLVVVPGGCRQRRGEGTGRHARVEHPLRPRPDRQGERDRQRRRAGHDRQRLPLPVEAGLRRHARTARRRRRAREAGIREEARSRHGRRLHR